MRDSMLILFAPAIVCAVWAAAYTFGVHGDRWVISFLVALCAAYVASEVERQRRWDRAP
jgi:hypothetical protein